MSPEGVFRWHDGVFVDDDGSRPTRVLAVDSWAAVDGRALALSAHFDRFRADVVDAAPELASALDAFWAASVSLVPGVGEWFPRLELVDLRGIRILRFHLRPAPTRSFAARLSTARSDPRTTPLVKGPDLEALAALRDAARAAGSDEAVILDPAGVIVEGAYSSIVWWRADALFVVDESLPRLPSVTEASLVTLALALGVDVLHEQVTPDDLDGLEVWVLNSLHGPRIATSWAGGPALAEEPGRLRQWRARLDRLARPLA